MSDRLFQREAPAADLLISGARLHDASLGLDGARLDVLITGGRIAEIDLVADPAKLPDLA